MYKGGNSDDIFRSKFEDFAPKPSNRIWENLQGSLPVPVPFYKKPSFWGSSAAAAALLLATFVFFSHYDLQIALVPQQNEKSTQAYGGPLVKGSNAIANKGSQSADSNTGAHYETNPNLQNPGKATNNSFTSTSDSKRRPLTANQPATASTNVFQSNRIANATTKAPSLASKNSMSAQLAKGNINSTAVASSNKPGTKPLDLAQRGKSNQLMPISEIVTGQNTVLGSKQLRPLAMLSGKQLKSEVIDGDIPVFKPNRNKFSEPFENLKGLSFGVTYAVNNTWLINNRDNLHTPTGTLEYRLDFGPAYGFTLGYTFNPRWGIQLDWVVNSNQGQKWSNQYGNYISYKENNLTYSHFPLLLKHKRAKESKLTKKPFVLNYIVGVQYSRLKSAEINVDNGLAQDLLKKTDWGLVLGFDYDLYLNKHFFFTVGTRSSLAASNDPLAIFSNKRNEARNFLMGVQASMHYKFSR